MYEAIIKYEPKNANAFFRKGVSLYNLKKYPSSLEAMNNAIDFEPKNVDAYIYKGKLIF